ncbi:MAG: hypothetical protein AMXMBFR55_23330 [Gemmatimonadota bacterium]
MSRSLRFQLIAGAAALALLVLPLRAQHADHAAHAARPGAGDSTQGLRAATLPGQDAFGAIAEVVRILRADPATDWSTVNLEALRQHLLDMNEVTLRSTVSATNVAGGVRVDVTGTGRARDAIRRMITAHAPMLAAEGLAGVADTIPGGMRWTVTTRDPARVAELRGLGFIGIMTLGEHHTVHHLQLARGGSHH